MYQEPDIKKVREKLYSQMTYGLTSSESIQVLSAYISNYDVQQLIKWNRLLAVSTVILAIATFILAYITYLK